MSGQVRSVADPPLHFGGIGFAATRRGDCDAFLLRVRDTFQMVESKSEKKHNFEVKKIEEVKMAVSI